MILTILSIVTNQILNFFFWLIKNSSYNIV